MSWERTHSWRFHGCDRKYFASCGLDLEPWIWLSQFFYNCMCLPRFMIIIILDYPCSPIPPVNLIKAIVWTQKEGYLVEHLQLPSPIPVRKKIILPQSSTAYNSWAMVQVSQDPSSLLMGCPCTTSSSVFIKANTAAGSKWGHKCNIDRRLIRIAFFLHLLYFSLGMVEGLSRCTL